MGHNRVSKYFSSFVLPYLLSEPDIEKRKKSLAACLAAWNLSLISESEQREACIDEIWDTDVGSDLGATQQGQEEIVKKTIENMIKEKLDLFPWLTSSIHSATLVSEGDDDILIVHTHEGSNKHKVAFAPSSGLLPGIINSLKTVKQTMLNQLDLMQKINTKLHLLDNARIDRMFHAFSLQRSELTSYRILIFSWEKMAPNPLANAMFAESLALTNEVENLTKKLLAIVCDAKFSKRL